MLTKVRAGNLTLSGVSVGGVYTGILAQELDSIFDVGIAPRSFVGASNLFISHGHADHVGSMITMLGIRGLSRAPAPRTFLPKELLPDLADAVDAMNRAQKRGLEVPWVGASPGDEFALKGDLVARAFRTQHTVPSLGYELFRQVQKLRPEFRELPAQEVRERRERGEDLFDTVERTELVYATDTLIDVLDENPRLYTAKVLVLECTFLDERKGRSECRDKGHIHLDEIVARAELFKNEHLVLMHFSQLYQPAEVWQILKSRLPVELAGKTRIFAPQSGPWPG